MKTSLEELEDNKVKLSIEVDEQEFETAVNAAFRKIAREVNIPGFRPGKAPRRLLEKRLGDGVARGEALREAIPDYYAKAVREHDVDVIAPPAIEITEGEDDGPVSFEAIVEVRPIVMVRGYENLRVTVARPEASDEEIDAQIDRMRTQHADLSAVERPAAAGDFVTIDVEGSQGGEPLAGLTALDYSYEVGSAGIVAELDEALLGASAGDTLDFDAEHPDDDEDGLHFNVTVKEVKERVLPDPDDAWAAEASEFETLDELRGDLAERITKVRRLQARLSLRDKVCDALAEIVEDDPPDALVDNEIQERLRDFAMRLQAQGMTLEQWLESSGQDTEEFIGGLRDLATKAARFDLGLRAVAEAEDLDVTEDDLEAEFAELSARLEIGEAKVRKQFVEADQLSALEGDIRRRKALDWLVATVEIVDEEGNVIDRADLEITAEDDDDQADAASVVSPTPEDGAAEAASEHGEDRE